MYFVYLFILSSLITVHSNGIKTIEKRTLTDSSYESYEEENKYYNHPGNRRNFKYSPWDYKDNKDASFEEDVQSTEELHPYGNSRRLFEWFSRLFHTTTPAIAQTSLTTQSTYTRELKERIFLRALHHNLTDVIHKLTDVEKHVSNAMAQKEAYSILIKGKPQVLGTGNSFYRYKRDVTDESKAENATKTNANDKVVVNKTKQAINVVNATQCPCDNNITSGRRAGSELPTPNEVKKKLLLYLEESFQEIKAKIDALKNLKQAFSDNISFKIGYIIANIDTLEVSMNNLKLDMEKNKQLWEDNKILGLYDTLKVSNQAVSGLTESLKVYLDQIRQSQRNPDTKFG